MLNKRTFEVVFVNKTNAVGIEKEIKGKTVSYEGSEIMIKL
jgi:alpha-D-xyloside xylohydrolase